MLELQEHETISFLNFGQLPIEIDQISLFRYSNQDKSFFQSDSFSEVIIDNMETSFVKVFLYGTSSISKFDNSPVGTTKTFIRPNFTKSGRFSLMHVRICSYLHLSAPICQIRQCHESCTCHHRSAYKGKPGTHQIFHGRGE
ncbi:hypothetical protein SAMN04488128_1021619 [Chitinophaga eiseniae]|uniref:Uncharacterized protein n=1 Tax=Chitinophaga eiseniae TaxID=634771 RepID=A0A1T4RZT7_9BACT|nr:hypothetical protein SAMN04488128_1021619 [Chitinophaga eiseniae]